MTVIVGREVDMLRVRHPELAISVVALCGN